MKRAHRTPGEVTVHVKGRNLTVTPALHDLAVAKLGKLDKYLDRLSNIDVELWNESTREAAQHNHVEVTARVAGKTLRVESNGSEMYVAIDDAVDKLYRQLNRQKERMKSHHGSRLAEAIAEPEDVTESELEGGDGAAQTDGPIIRVEPLHLEPQFEDEAVQDLEAGKHDFYVFLNARNEQINVLYRHEDGSYGLIEPSAR